MRNRIVQSAGLLVFMLMIGACHNSIKQKGLVYFNDFENIKGWAVGYTLTKAPVHAGIFACKMDTAHVYGPTLRLRFDEISPLPIVKLKYSMWCFLRSTNSIGKIVVSVDDIAHKNITWDAKHIPDLTKVTGKWVELKGEFVLSKNDANAATNTVSIYPWITGKDEIYIDDFKVEFVQ
ncbi:MAG: hypothetical protein ACHQRM_12255 [Bacteroidia bacterium]